MPGEMADKLEYRNIGQEKYEKNKSDTCRQMDCQTVVQYVSDQMPNRMSLRMSEYVANMSDRMPLFIYIYISNNMSASNSYIMHMFVDGDHSK